MLTVERNSEDARLILVALQSMALRHAEWYRLESCKRNTDNDKLRYHLQQQSKYKKLADRMKDELDDPAATDAAT